MQRKQTYRANSCTSFWPIQKKVAFMPLPWIPPIPGGKLTSKPARDLGPAIVFLLWCYDAVHRDGTFEFEVKEVAGYLEESYYTVRKWWAAVKGGPWFETVTDRGKLGFRVKMADEWLEWRAVKVQSSENEVPEQVLEEKGAQAKSQSNHNHVPDAVLDEEEQADQPLVKSPSNRNEVPTPVLEESAYKVLHDDHEGGADESEKRSKLAPAPLFQKLAEICSIPIALASPKQRADLGSVATALHTAGATVEQLDAFSVWWWSDSNWRTRKARENKRKPEAPRPREVREEWGNAILPAANGHKPQGRGPPVSTIPADAHSTDSGVRKLVEMRHEQQGREKPTGQH